MIIGSTAYALDHATKHQRRSVRQHLNRTRSAINYRNLFLIFSLFLFAHFHRLILSLPVRNFFEDLNF